MRFSLLYTLIIFLFFSGCSGEDSATETFKVAFFTDIHLNKGETGSFEGLGKALESAAGFNVDFVLTGGDNMDIDVLKEDSTTAFELFDRFSKVIKDYSVPVYLTIGNHDRYTGAYFNDPKRGSVLFESYFDQSYYHFDHKGWHFIVLNTVQVVDGQYAVGPDQYEWLRAEIEGIGTGEPIVLVGHVPFLSVYTPAVSETYGFDSFSNFREILNLLSNHNLKLVLQGHQHLYEEIYTRGVQYITGGAVSASWWGGPYYGTEEGYLLLSFTNNSFDWKYVDYGWEVSAD